MNISLPHDRSDFFSTERYWNAVENFLENELKNDGQEITSEIFLENKKGKVFVIAKESGVFSGKKELEFFLQKFFPEISYHWEKSLEEGQNIDTSQKIFWAEGNAYDLMKMERIFLNILSRMSGISTTTQKLLKISEQKNTSGIPISATRKTQWSYLDKKAVHIGGGLTHRMGLFDAIMIKENHQIMSNYQLPIAEYLQKTSPTSENSPHFIEIEVETPEEFQNIFDIFWNAPEKNTLPKVIMLDNFSPEKIINTLKKFPDLKSRHQKNIFLEASGGINEKNISDYKNSGVDVISMGFLTNTVTPIDFSMRAFS